MGSNFLEIKFNKEQPSINTSKYPTRNTMVFNTKTKNFDNFEKSEYLLVVNAPEDNKKNALRSYYEKVALLMKEQNPLIVIFDIKSLKYLVELKAIHNKFIIFSQLIHFDLGLFEINEQQWLQVFFCAKLNKSYKQFANKKEKSSFIIFLQKHMIELWNKTNKKSLENMINISSDAITEALIELYAAENQNATIN